MFLRARELFRYDLHSNRTVVINSIAIESSIAVGTGCNVRRVPREGVENTFGKENGHDGGIEGGGRGVSVRVGEGGEGVGAGHVPDMFRSGDVLYRYLVAAFQPESGKRECDNRKRHTRTYVV